ncbi:MAG: hypothetical protein RXQ94_09535 [Caldivirga sp.]
MIDKILVDWDIPFEEFKRKYINIFNVRARELLGPSIRSIGYVKSSGGNTHIVVYLSEPIPERDAVIYAALLGSDFRRECLNWRRLHCMGSAESWFFNDYRQKTKGKKSMSPVGLKKFIEVNCPDLPREMVKTMDTRVNAIVEVMAKHALYILSVVTGLAILMKAVELGGLHVNTSD